LVRSIPPRVILAIKLALATLAIIVVATMVDWRTVATDPHQLILPIFGGFAIMVPATLAVAFRWKLLIGSETPRHFSFLNAVRGWCLGLFFNMVVPGVVGGDVARAHYASVRAQIKYPHSLLVAFTERLFGLLTICLLGTIGLLVNDNLNRFTKAPALQLVLAILLISAIVLAGIRLIHRYSRISPLLFPSLLLLTIAGQSSDFLLVHFYGRVVSVNIPLTTLLVVLPLVFLATVLSLTPGGTGVREATLTALLTLSGVPVSAAALVALMLLVTKVGFALLCGLAIFGGISQFGRRWNPLRRSADRADDLSSPPP
jgi:uncharacterized membrane protein YbhN (UPF0104 family)